MNVAHRLGIRVHDPSRVVYVREGEGPCVLDSWGATTGLRRRLDDAQELVLVDPLSFPYEQLTSTDRAVPVTVVLPPTTTVDDLVALLGEPLLGHLTPADRVVGDPRTVAALQERGELGPVDVVAVDGDDPLDALHAAWREERTVTVDAAIGRLTGHRHDIATRQLAERGARQRPDLATLLPIVRPGDVVFDIGAHVGLSTVALAVACGDTGRVVAFEGSPSTYELLTENVVQNELSWVDAVHAVVTDRSGVVAVASPAPVGDTGATTLRPTWDDRGGVPSTSVDDWWREEGRPRVDVVKVDVGGHGLRVVRGARELLAAHAPVLQVAIAEDRLADEGVRGAQVLSLLRDLGYRCWANAPDHHGRDDDRLALEPVDESAPVGDRVVDVLCAVDESRILHDG